MSELLHFNGRFRHVTIENRRGEKINYLDAGQITAHGKTNPVIVFHHGFGSSWQAFSPQIDHFARAGYRIILVDRSGQGQTPYHPRENVHDHVSDVEDVLNHLNIRHADHIAHSYGSRVMMEFAAKNPKQVGKLVGISMFDVHTDLMRRLGLYGRRVFRNFGIVKPLQQLISLVSLKWAYENQDIGREVIRATPEPAAQALDDEFRIFSRHHLPLEENIHSPILAIQSIRDGIIPEDSLAVLRHIYSNITTLTLSDCNSHNPQIEHGEKVNKIIQDFLTSETRPGRTNSSEKVHE